MAGQVRFIEDQGRAHMLSSEFMEKLHEGADVLGVELSSSQLESFDLYRQELKKWGRVYNITSRLGDRDILVRHFLDSLFYLQGVPEGTGLSLADAGSGAGFPGIPIAIARPDLRVSLIEPTRKKALFLQNIKRKLNLSLVAVINERVENVEPAAGPFDILVTRALWDAESFMARTRHLTESGTRWILSKGRNYEDELKGLEGSLEIKRTTLPFENLNRWLIILIT